MSLGTRRRAAVFSGILGVLFALFLGAAGQAFAHSTGLHVTLCHATGSAANPYNAVTVDINSVADAQNAGGHGDHDNDVIPSYTFGGYTYPGKNLDVLATLDASTCESLAPTSTTSTSTSTTSTSSTSTSTTSTSSTSTSTPWTGTTSTTAPESTTVVTEGTTATTSPSTTTPTTEVSTTTTIVVSGSTLAPTSSVPVTEGSTVAQSTTTTTHATGPTTLPFTGGSTGPLVMLGAGLAAVGIMLVRVRRRATR